MENVKFVHKVSRGSKFNQVYIPKENEKEFEPGELSGGTIIKERF